MEEINDQISYLTSLNSLVRVYTKVSAGRISRSRDYVLYTRTYLAQLRYVFDAVRGAYEEESIKLAKKRRLSSGEALTFLAHNGKTVSVFISANTKLYGDLIGRTFDMFIDDLKTGQSEATVVGKIGLSDYKSVMGDETPVTYFDMPDGKVDNELLRTLLMHLVQYEEIKVYFGKYVSTINQEPSVFHLSASVAKAQKRRVNAPKEKYLIEPSLESVLQYFEKEIFTSLFEQTIKESQLAKHAARLTSMDRANERIKRKLKLVKTEALKQKHELASKRQINSIATYMHKFS